MKYLRTAEFKPYVIYIKPPPLALLKQTRQAAHAKSTFDEASSRGFTVSLVEKTNIFYKEITWASYIDNYSSDKAI